MEAEGDKLRAVAPEYLIQTFLQTSVEQTTEIVFSYVYSYALRPAAFIREVIAPIHPPPESEDARYKVTCKRVERVVKSWVRHNEWDLAMGTLLSDALGQITTELLQSSSESLAKLATGLNIHLLQTRSDAQSLRELAEERLHRLLALHERVAFRKAAGDEGGGGDGHLSGEEGG
ncbi:MAG: hypothetical protein Q8P67_01205, partial [archaeon]|nr:hypothetical protein [archaeon]